MTTDSGAVPEPGGSGAEGDVTGGLPAGWVRATIGELCDVNPRGFDEEPGDDELISQVPMAAVEAVTGRMDASTQVRYGDVKKKSLTRFQENDVLFAKITPCMENGKITKAQGLVGGRALGSTEFHVLRSRGAVLPEYLMHFLLQQHVRRAAEQHMTGAVGQRRVPRPYLAELEIPVPPLAEQHRIVAKLEDQLARIEAGAHSIGYALQRAEQLPTAILDSLVEGLKAEGVAVNPLSSLLGEPLRNGISAKATRSAGGIRTLTLTAVTRGKFIDQYTKMTEADSRKAEKLWLRDGDIFVQRSNSAELVGTSAIYRGADRWAIYPDLLIRVRVDARRVVAGYVALVLRTSEVRHKFRQSARGLSGSMPKIDQSTIEDVPVPVPSLERQHEIVEQVQEREAALSPLMDSISATEREGENLRDALLHAAFTGTLLPQDPDDEPASVLLDRIRAQRAVGAKPARRKRAPRKTSPAAPEPSGRPVPSGTQEALPL